MGRLRYDKNSLNVLNSLETVFVSEPTSLKSKWNKYFKNDKPIDIEIGSGKCKFIFNISQSDKKTNYIGIEKFASVLQKISNFEIEQIQDNCKVICFDAMAIEELFEPGEVRNIYLNFSDPWPKKRHEKRRLTSRNFVEKYRKVMSKEGLIIFKTDNDSLYQYTNEQIIEHKYKVFQNIEDIYLDEKELLTNIQTEYEKKFMARGNKIKKIVFSPF